MEQHTVTFTINGEDNIQELVRAVIYRSQWFMVTPLPDDCWELTVKAENLIMVQAAMKRMGLELGIS